MVMKKTIKFSLLILLAIFGLNTEAQSLVSFGPSLSYIRVDDVSVSSIPYATPLTVSIDVASATDIFIAISSAAPGSLTIMGGGVTITAGSTSAVVLMNGISQNESVELTASLNIQQLTANVRVVGLTELPKLVAISPFTNQILPWGTLNLSAEIDIPSYNNPVTINLSVNPTNAGTIPVMVTIPAFEVSASFSYVDANIASSCVITGDDGSYQSSASVDMTTLGSLNSILESPCLIFPNPFSNQITLAISGDQPSTLILYNIYSQVVLK